ncbi:unnamed protein product [Phyllotreta striolata]|uniref:CDP-diacylglycerol--glycerol-3-phosphate 3-phosphatidyltransferase n=1 Tax=Phyllotreta striolata TaxID=444603 RepID=A0A9N9U0J0_PHYSR|nr:unnamed protein product [Phyllotreta striolata]
MIRRLLSNAIETALPAETTHSQTFFKNEFATFKWLTSTGPCFPVKAQNITILTDPSEFFDALLTNCTNAKERITLASLYLGNGPLEKKLLGCIRNNRCYRNNTLNINILLDYTRGSRHESNSRTVLLPFINENSKLKVSLYHTPLLRGYLKKCIPHRWNELLGLQHMKLYVFDNTLIISGANLSNDYFTNRQDRYFVIKDKNLCDFYCDLVSKVQEFSLNLNGQNETSLSGNWDTLPYESNNDNFVKKASENIQRFVTENTNRQIAETNEEECDTWIFPLIQMGQLGIEHDALVTSKLIAEAPSGSHLKISTGYFNLTTDYMNTLIQHCRATCDILMAHPKANGFLGARGLAGGIPYAYSLIARNFKEMCKNNNQLERIYLLEYYKEGWTYHAKGLWYYPPTANVPCLTLIGSPNFGERSVKRDLETQVAIVTDNPELRKSLDNECRRLYDTSEVADIDRKVPVWVNAFVVFFRSYF